ncbi:hypothetical protein J6590_004194 [Homalodisca vitripennis]|nr:hypothetical protein J6590_004194 [Homalodisca vitripennis]
MGSEDRRMAEWCSVFVILVKFEFGHSRRHNFNILLLNLSAEGPEVAVKEDAPRVALPAKNCKTESENDPPPMIPKIIRVLHDMRQDLVLLRNLRAFLASLRQFNRFVNLSGQPFLGQENSQDAIRGA